MYPVLRIGPYALPAFSVMVGLGLLVGSTVLLAEARRLRDPRITDGRVLALVWCVALAVLGGGRLMYVVERWGYFSGHLLEIPALWDGGLVMYGGVLAVFLTVAGFAHLSRIGILRLWDLVAPSSFLGAAIGRWGCFLAGDDYGRPIRAPAWRWLGVRFTSPQSLVPRLDPSTLEPLQGELLYPTQLMLSLKCALVAGALFWLTRRKRFDGQVAATAFLLYPVLRVMVEPFRGDHRSFVGPLPTAQLTSMLVFASGLLLYLIAARRGATMSTGARIGEPRRRLRGERA